MIRAIVTWAAAAAAGLALVTACTSANNDKPGPSATARATSATAVTGSNGGTANAADAAFVTALSGIGTQNLSMAALVGTRAGHPQLAALLPVIEQHAGDVGAMRAWLAQWHTPGATGTAAPTGVTSAMLTAMAGMHGAMFDDSWLEHMGANYANAITACQDELAHGRNTQARQLATDWMRWMHDQLGQMRQWHDTWTHDDRFPPMMSGSDATTPSRAVASSHSTDVPHPGTAHMSDMPRQETTPYSSGAPHPATTSHMDGGHRSGTDHMTSPHE